MSNRDNKKVLLILTDGMHPDVLEHIPNAIEFINESAATLKGRTVMPSDTLPCHFSLFKSVTPEKHRIIDNGYTNPEKDYRTICDVLRLRDKKCAMFYSWEELKYLTRPNDIAYSCYINKEFYGDKETAQKLSDKTIDFIKNDFASFTFLHYDYIDHIGHEYGWLSEEYIEAVQFIWDEIYRVTSVCDDDTTIIIISDHSGHNNDHGDECDTLIPVIIKGKEFRKGSTLNDVSIMDIAPTVMNILGIAPDDEWDGMSII